MTRTKRTAEGTVFESKLKRKKIKQLPELSSKKLKFRK